MIFTYIYFPFPFIQFVKYTRMYDMFYRVVHESISLDNLYQHNTISQKKSLELSLFEN